MTKPNKHFVVVVDDPTVDPDSHETEAGAISAAKEWAEAYPGSEALVFKLHAKVKSEPAVSYVEERKPKAIDQLREKAEKVTPTGPKKLPPPNVPGGRVRRMPV